MHNGLRNSKTVDDNSSSIWEPHVTFIRFSLIAIFFESLSLSQFGFKTSVSRTSSRSGSDSTPNNTILLFIGTYSSLESSSSIAFVDTGAASSISVETLSDEGRMSLLFTSKNSASFFGSPNSTTSTSLPIVSLSVSLLDLFSSFAFSTLSNIDNPLSMGISEEVALHGWVREFPREFSNDVRPFNTSADSCGFSSRLAAL